MCDVHAVRGEFARHALRQATQRELAHRKGAGLRIALHRGGSTGEQDRAGLLRHHQARRLLTDKESAKSADGDGVRHLLRHQGCDRPARPCRGVVNHNVWFTERGDHGIEQARNLLRLRSFACKGRGSGLIAQGCQPIGITRGQGDLHVFMCEAACQRGGEARAGSDDQGNPRVVHPSSRCESRTYDLGGSGTGALHITIPYGFRQSFGRADLVTVHRGSDRTRPALGRWRSPSLRGMVERAVLATRPRPDLVRSAAGCAQLHRHDFRVRGVCRADFCAGSGHGRRHSAPSRSRPPVRPAPQRAAGRPAQCFW